MFFIILSLIWKRGCSAVTPVVNVNECVNTQGYKLSIIRSGCLLESNRYTYTVLQARSLNFC